MTRPTRRPGSSFHLFRKRIPGDIQRAAAGRRFAVQFPGERPGDPPVVVTATIAHEVKFSLRTRDPVQAKERTGIALVQVERLFSDIRKGPRRLTNKEVVALAGLAYRGFAEGGEDDPGSAEVWTRVITANEAAVDGAYGGADLIIGGDSDRYRAAMELRFGGIADGLLTGQNIVTDAESRWRLIGELASALTQAAGKLRGNANGDYRPDPNAARFPPWAAHVPATPAAPKESGSLTFDDLFDRWQRERKPAPGTVATWRGYVRGLQKHLGHDDPAQVTKADIVAWKDALIAADYSPKGIKDGQLTAAKTLFSYAVANDWLPTNPAQGVTLRVRRVAGTGMRDYTDDDVGRLLALSDSAGAGKPDRYWIPWLTALSGARVGEVAQLWGKSITTVDGIAVMKIAPAEDGGTLKNDLSERTVPLHPAIIERGFLDYVRARGDGPLFYRRRGKGNRHASKGVANHLAAWIRENGFTDKRKAPNHALRHWFKTACQSLGLPDSIADAIQGQSGNRGEADRYRHASVRVMYDAIRRIPVPASRSSDVPRVHEESSSRPSRAGATPAEEV